MRYLENSNPEGWTDDQYNVGPRKNYEGGFARRMMVVNPTGIPNDGSDTFAPGMPGSVVIPNRVTPSSLIHSTADREELPLPGDRIRNEYPITSHQTPGQLWTRLPGDKMPLDFDKHLWTGEVPVNESVVDYTLPQPYAQGEEQIVDLAGLGGFGMVDLEGMSDSDVDEELAGLSDGEVEEQLQQLGYFLGDEDGNDTMLGRRKKKGFFRKRLAKHKRMHRKSMSIFKKKKNRRNEGFSSSEEEVGAAQAHDQGLHREGAHAMAPGLQVDGLGAFSSLTDSYLSEFEAGNPGYLADTDAYLADAYIDTELQMEGVSLGLLTKGERQRVRAEFRKCRRAAKQAHRAAKEACRAKFEIRRGEERLDGMGCCPPKMNGLGAYMTDSYLSGGRLGAIDWMSAAGSLASNIVSGVTGGAIPASTVQSAINTGVSYYTNTGTVPTTQQIAAGTPPPIIQKAAFGIGTMVPIGIGLFILSKVMGGKKRR
jgi:hypothetical protein